MRRPRTNSQTGRIRAKGLAEPYRSLNFAADDSKSPPVMAIQDELAATRPIRKMAPKLVALPRLKFVFRSPRPEKTRPIRRTRANKPTRRQNDGRLRSEERRVGKERRSRWSPYY